MTALPTVYQEFIAVSRYARFRSDLGRRETWHDTTSRYGDFWHKHFKKVMTPELSAAIDEAQASVETLDNMPSMRSLMTAGPALERSHTAGYNCSFATISGSGPTVELWDDKLRDLGHDEPIKVKLHDPLVFDEGFYVLLCGTGFGFSVERQFINDLPKVGKPLSRASYKKNAKNFPKVPREDLSSYDKKTNTVVVADSKEGWSSALRIFIVELYNGNFSIKYDVSGVRPAGQPLKTFGGRSSGPDALVKMFEEVRAVFIKADGRKLNSVECHDIMCHIASAVVVGGVRRCLPENTPVMTPTGFMPIKDIIVGDTIITGGETAKVVAAEYTGEKETVVLKHRFGEIECTPEHRVAVFNSIMKYEFKPASEVVEGDRLVWDSVGYDGVETALPKFKQNGHFNSNDITFPEKVNTDLAWLVGLIQGDGYVGDKTLEIAGNMGQIHFLAKAAQILEREFGLVSTYGGDGKPGVGARLRAHSTALADWLFNNVKQPKVPIYIPEFISQASREIRFAYLSGLLDADGRVKIAESRIDAACTIYESFADELITLFAGLGIAAIKSFTDATNRRNNGSKAHDSYNVFVRGNTNREKFYMGAKDYCFKLDGYSNKYENSSVDFSFPVRWCDSHEGYKANGNIGVRTMRYDAPPLPTRVLSVGAGRTVRTYDIQVENLERFSANGLVVHNSAMISLSNLSDERMRYAKSGAWWDETPQRSLANNSVAYTEKPEIGQFMREWQALYESKSGERGIFNREAMIRTAAEFGRTLTATSGINPCGELPLNNNEFCNLSSSVIRPDDTLETLKEKVRISTFIGTMQATLTDFSYLSPVWKETCEEERLLGVSLPGGADHPILSQVSDEAKRWLKELSAVVDETNAKWAKLFGINAAAGKRCQKPAGNSGELYNVASGIHPRYAPFYTRRVRADGNDPLAKVMRAQGFPCEVDVMHPNTLVFSFPVKAPAGAVLRNDRTAMEQLEYWLMWKQHWSDHSVSATIYVKEHEWLQVGAWVYEHFDEITGLSFLPHSDHSYKQAPYEEITEAEYEEMSAIMPAYIDYDALSKLEVTDHTTSSQEFACAGGACEIM